MKIVYESITPCYIVHRVASEIHTGIDTGFRTFYQWLFDYEGRYKIIKREDYGNLG